MRDLDPSQFGQADRREIDPPIQVETATWSKAGRLDWWVPQGANVVDPETGESLGSVEIDKVLVKVVRVLAPTPGSHQG
jgi:hypothetical protein